MRLVENPEELFPIETQFKNLELISRNRGLSNQNFFVPNASMIQTRNSSACCALRFIRE